jgi:hypothetical protein
MSAYKLGLRGLVQDHNIAAALSPGKTGGSRRGTTSSNIGQDKSFVYDLNIERGIVRKRVALVPRSAEIKPRFDRFVTISSLSLPFSPLFFSLLSFFSLFHFFC